MIQLNGAALAYIGDAYYELCIRRYLIDRQLTKVNDLHKEAITFTSAVSQAKAADYLLEHFYNEEEVGIFKRGRNQTSGRKPKNTDLATYHAATGFEAVIGYLYLDQRKDRLDDLINQTIDHLERCL